MPKLIIVAVLWIMAAAGVLQRNTNIERKYQCSFGLSAHVTSVAFAPAIFVLALVADNERITPPSWCEIEEQ